MIIPTPEFDPLFATDGVPFRTKMIDYIRREFADLMESRAVVLESADELHSRSGHNPRCPATRRGPSQPAQKDAA